MSSPTCGRRCTLDQPLPVQYGPTGLGGVLQGDLGDSLSSRPVTELIRKSCRLPVNSPPGDRHRARHLHYCACRDFGGRKTDTAWD